jgi:threonine aldolase
VLCGDADFIERAHRFRKILGGGMRQLGILASAGLYAIENNVSRLKEDHAKAKYFAKNLVGIHGFEIDLETVQTNIVIIDVSKASNEAEGIVESLRQHGVLLTEGGFRKIRAVMHLDVSFEEVKESVGIFHSLFA